MKNPIMKKMMREAEKWYSDKKAELNMLQGKKQIIENEIGRMIGGKQEHRDNSFLNTIDGTLLRVNTNNFAEVVDVTPIKSFEELSTGERSALYESDKKLYKMLEHGLYQPKMNERIIDLMVTEGVKYEEFELISETPQKPDLTGLDLVDSQKVITEYRQATEAHTERLNTYRQDVEAYRSGKMNQDLREVEDKIAEVQAEIS
ncbi:hypothetical protein J7E81_15255 [Bacillus sp. ISL-18]|uniref:hypothetical protein n=1 Tax=Bacillus sp. ISL-18 TaxID=2819118 RepID=UPI001BE62C98|nr:hypothetical protein [Bacillus sp. ISL-18]MBT2656575.1 hypothetical protein [Bacillus sp. ISL-18]